MTRPAAPASPSNPEASANVSHGFGERLWQIIAVATFGALTVVTLSSPGATRMYAWPWSLAYAVALLGPALMLLLRAFDSRRPLALPSAGWCAALLAATGGILASALASPYRGVALLWSAPLLAGVAAFFVIFDGLHTDAATADRKRDRLLVLTGYFFGAVALVGMGLWLGRIPTLAPGSIFAARNPFPLGHSNYAAGLALLMLPLFLMLAGRTAGARRVMWGAAELLALGLLFTSGSRGGLVGLAVLAVFHVRLIARILRLKTWMVVVGGALALVAFIYWNPRTRAAISGDELKASDVQRTAMLTAGWRMGVDRPLLGWGPGVTPLAYPRYRAGLPGGTEDILQLHSTPVQLWAELGAVGVVCALALVALAIRTARTSPAAASTLLALGGYAVFSFTDWQLDVPVFAFAVAAGMALIARPAPRFTLEPKLLPLLRLGSRSVSVRLHEDYPALRRVLGLATLLALTCVALLGRPDPAPVLNLRALALAGDPAHTRDAVVLLQQSLALNPDQEIAHFNLGWLLLVPEPADAERHFLAAARLVPDKGGVYFGLGLARLNQGRRAEAERAFALECFNDPAFIVSPWWRTPGVAERWINTVAQLIQLQSLALQALPEKSPLYREARYLREFTLWLTMKNAPVTHPNNAARETYFVSKPAPPPFEKAPGKTYRRERTGYPVLMRNLDLPVPVDLFDVQENSLASGEFGFLFPPKGWLASPLLPALLIESESPKK